MVVSGVFIGGLIGSAVYVLFTYYAGAKMALAVNGAKEIQKRDNPRLYRYGRKSLDCQWHADAKGLHHG